MAEGVPVALRVKDRALKFNRLSQGAGASQGQAPVIGEGKSLIFRDLSLMASGAVAGSGATSFGFFLGTIRHRAA
jgi:hypothetical protein